MTTVQFYDFNHSKDGIEGGTGIIFARHSSRVNSNLQLFCGLATDCATMVADAFADITLEDCNAVVAKEIACIHGERCREPLDANLMDCLVATVGSTIFEAQQEGLAMLTRNALPQYTSVTQAQGSVVTLYVPCNGVYREEGRR